MYSCLTHEPAINSKYFPIQMSPIGLTEGNTVCLRADASNSIIICNDYFILFLRKYED